jgi:hypothetical protein
MKKKVKCKTSHGKNDQKDELGSFWSESFKIKCGTPIMLRLGSEKLA